ncbi:MAG: hypothetical protein IJ148_00440 [Bacteroidaceae bacterium]|nr:hypothetical protein [Bacteroidaceae bacterium]MBQ9169279.1 hypothetical protein [Bacteroidaceae bacterium]
MNFFKKKDREEPKPVEQESPRQEAVAASVPTEKGINFIIEETSGSTRSRRDSRILNSTQLQRVKDAKRLAETKLQGLEESLTRLQKQLAWLRRYNETSMILEREKKHLFELGKEKATMAKEQSMLDRYDLFEGIHGVYQKLAVVKEQIGRDKRGLSLLEREADEFRQKTAEQEKRQTQAGELYKNATQSLLDTFDRVSNAAQLTGNNESLDNETVFLTDYINKVREEAKALSSMIAEKEKETEALQDILEKLCCKRQSMEIHESMLQHGEAVLLQLKYLEEREKRRAELQLKRQQAIKSQNEENELLGKAFAQFQDLVSKAETTEAELSMHRSYIQGQDGLMLQERALQLKGRRQMLHSALSLWKRISTGYESIEEKSKKVTQLRLDIGHLEDGVRQLEEETGKVQRLCKEKEYTYLLSKGQDIIQLRADLKEGVSCSVCGATHHPYHSDTMLDQSKLISEMKSDYEMLASEAKAKAQQLSEMQIELAMAQGQLSAEEEALNAIRIRQNEDVLEWKLYAQLDPTFAECSENTNLEARMALLRQFIENVSRDAETAEKELETFTFHQSSIAKLGEELQKIEQKKSEVNVRLSELNTGLQVFSREVEQIVERLENINKQYTRLYENMMQTVTIKDWYAIWQRNPEQLYEQIQKLITEWFATEEDIARKQASLNVENANLEGMRSLLNSLTRTSTIAQKRKEDVEERKAENIKAYQQMIPDMDAKSLHQKHLQNVRDAKERFEQERSLSDSIRHDNDIMQGRHDYYMSHIEILEAEQKELGEKLDLWMHAFNLQHPPVQRGELDEVFADGKDWAGIRSSLKQINKDILLCQAKVDDLNSRIIALEAEDGRCSAQSPDIQESITANWQTLAKQRSETMKQIARLAVQLEDHERAVAAERNSAEMSAKSQPEINLT